MSEKNSSSSSSSSNLLVDRHFHNSDYLPPSNSSRTSLFKRRFSATKMLAKAKDTTKSLVNEVLEKRHSMDSSRRSMDEEPVNIQQPRPQSSSSSLSSIEKLKAAASSSTSNLAATEDNSISRTLSSKQKHYSLPVRRPFTIRKEKTRNSLDSSLSSFSSSSSTAAPYNNEEDEAAAKSTPPPSNAAAAAAEADILSGSIRPGSFATACDFRLANEKKNEEFHALFKSVPVSDMLIQDYKCALQKDILLQGHLYVSEHHVCFKSNIFGWVTNLVINFEEITQVEKKLTAKIIPNGITISTSTSKHVFASFLSRDQAYDQIVKIWDLCKRAANSVIPSSSCFDDTNSLYEEGETDEESIPDMDSAVLLSPPLLITTEEDTQHHHGLIESAAKPNNSSTSTAAATNNNTSPSNKITLLPTDSSAYLKESPLLSTLNRPRAVSDSYRERRTAVIPNKTDTSSLKRETLLQSITPIKRTRVCPCTVKGEQYTHIALNETYTGTVESLFKLLYDSDFFKGFLERYENFEEVQLGTWKHGAREVIGKRRIKSSTMGAKVVKTLFQEKRIHRKYPYYSCVTAKKSMPDMPMGAVYSIQSRTCITRVSKDKVHVLITFQVAFTKSGLISSIIEKNAADDQLRQYTHLHSILNKPDLIRELVNDPQILQDLDMTAEKSLPEKQAVASKDWLSSAIHRVQSIRLIHFICMGFFFVILTHCVLALRLQRITRRLDIVQQQKSLQQDKDIRDALWISAKMDRVSSSLNQIHGQVQDYDQRIKNMKNMKNNVQ